MNEIESRQNRSRFRSPIRDLKAELLSLRQHYTILDYRLLIGLLNDAPALVSFLMGALRPLRNAFGRRHIMQIRVHVPGDDSLVKVVVQVPAESWRQTRTPLTVF